MAWIESHQSLLKHPKVSRFARILGINKAEAIGRLHMLWWWSLDYAQNGELSSYYPDEIAEASDWKEDSEFFVSALIQAGFLDENPLRLHDWYDYAGRFIEQCEIGKTKNSQRQEDAETRILNAVANLREQGQPISLNAIVGEAHCSKTTAQRVLKNLEAGKDGTGGMVQAVRYGMVRYRPTLPNLTIPNSTKDKKNMRNSFDGAQSMTGKDAEGEQKPDVPAERSDDYTSEFLEFWERYPRRVDKQRAFRVWKTRLKDKHTPNDMIQAAINYASYCSAQRTEVQFIKHPATFLGPDKPFTEFVNGYTVQTQPNNVGVNDVLERARQNMFGG